VDGSGASPEFEADSVGTCACERLDRCDWVDDLNGRTGKDRRRCLSHASRFERGTRSVRGISTVLHPQLVETHQSC
jgi:hypothetical protein